MVAAGRGPGSRASGSERLLQGRFGLCSQPLPAESSTPALDDKLAWRRCPLTFRGWGLTFFASCWRSSRAASALRGHAPSPRPPSQVRRARRFRATSRAVPAAPATPVLSSGGSADAASRPAGALPGMERGHAGRAGVRRKRCVIPWGRGLLARVPVPGSRLSPLLPCDLRGGSLAPGPWRGRELASVRPCRSLRSTVTVALLFGDPRHGHVDGDRTHSPDVRPGLKAWRGHSHVSGRLVPSVLHCLKRRGSGLY